MQKKLVLSSSGRTILPTVGVAREVPTGRLTAAPLSEPAVSRSIVLGQQQRRRSPRSVRINAQELRAIFDALVKDGTWPSARLSPAPERSRVDVAPPVDALDD